MITIWSLGNRQTERFFWCLRVMIYLSRCPVTQGLMEPRVIIEPEVVTKFSSGLIGAGVGLQVNLLILHRPPQPLHHDVVLVPPIAVLADLHPLVLKLPGEPLAGELAPLVGVEHSGFPRPRASDRASAQKPASSVLDSRRATAYRLYQSMMATR